MKPSYPGVYSQKPHVMSSQITKKAEKPVIPSSLLKKPTLASKPALPSKHSFMCGSYLRSHEVRG